MSPLVIKSDLLLFKGAVMQEGCQYINNQWVKGEAEEIFSINPATNEGIWQGKAASITQVSEAVAAAKSAFNEWRTLTFDERRHYIQRFVTLIDKDRQKYRDAISHEMGKPYWEADMEVGAVINKLAISLESYQERCPEKKQDKAGVAAMLRHKPHGVVAVFGPFNFPMHLPNGHIVPALLAGNTVVFKPSDQTPMVGELMVKAWEAAGLPPGVINCVQGGAEAGKTLAEHPAIDGIFFTGSYRVGKILTDVVTRMPNRILALEMGGNNPLIVHDVEDIDAAIYHTIQSAFITSGQRCTCARRLILTKKPKHEAFLEDLIKVTQKVVIGNATDEPEPFMGPVVSMDAAGVITDHYQQLIKQGAKALLPLTHPKETAHLTPGIVDVTGVNNKSDEECFGPLLQVVWVNDFDKAIEILRVRGISKASKKMSRDAKEGVVVVSGDENKTSVIEVNCETDFVAKNDDFINFVKELSELNNQNNSDVEKLKKSKMKNDITVEENLVALIAKIGEKITIGKTKTISNSSSVNYQYLHTVVKDNLAKLAVIVSLETKDNSETVKTFGKQLSMHIAASNPLALESKLIDKAIIDKEQELVTEELKNSGKPEEIAKKISLGKMNKFKEENALLTQAWVMEPKKKVQDVLKELAINDLKIKEFSRIKIGE